MDGGTLPRRSITGFGILELSFVGYHMMTDAAIMLILEKSSQASYLRGRTRTMLHRCSGLELPMPVIFGGRAVM